MAANPIADPHRPLEPASRANATARVMLAHFPLWITALPCRMFGSCRERGAESEGMEHGTTDGAGGGRDRRSLGDRRGTVRRFVKEGAKVAFADRDADRG